MSSRLVLIVCLIAAGCSDLIEPIQPSARFSIGELGSSGLIIVTSAEDSGPGTFRAAVELANGDLSIRTIRATPGLAPVQLLAPVVVTAPQDLRLEALGMTLDGSALGAGEPNLLITGGGDLEIADLIVRDAPGHGMSIQIPSDAAGVKKISLTNMVAESNLGHGVEINDQEDPDDAGDPDIGIRGNSNGSAVTLDVRVLASRFDDNGFGALDRDGLRVNEGGLGSLVFSIVRSSATGNGADGVELDERGDGDITFQIIQSHFSANGDFDQSADPDKDDGFDADELDAGDFTATVMHSTANDNLEEGFDFNENDAGDMRIAMKHSTANGNPEEGIDLEEDDDWQGGGDLTAEIEQIEANRNGAAGGDGGLKIRERGDGALVANVFKSRADDNVAAGIHMREQNDGGLQALVRESVASGNGSTGIFLREDDVGDHQGTVERSTADGNGAMGIDFDENGTGDLAAGVSQTSASNNAGFGVRADEAGDGTGTLRLHDVTLSGNGSAGTTGNVPPTP